MPPWTSPRRLNKPGAGASSGARATEFRRDLVVSLREAMARHRIAYVPGAAELGDFDPTSTTIAFAPAGAPTLLPRAAVAATFERYWQRVRRAPRRPQGLGGLHAVRAAHRRHVRAARMARAGARAARILPGRAAARGVESVARSRRARCAAAALRRRHAAWLGRLGLRSLGAGPLRLRTRAGQRAGRRGRRSRRAGFAARASRSRDCARSTACSATRCGTTESASTSRVEDGSARARRAGSLSCGPATRRPAPRRVNGKPVPWEDNELRIRELPATIVIDAR